MEMAGMANHLVNEPVTRGLLFHGSQYANAVSMNPACSPEQRGHNMSVRPLISTKTAESWWQIKPNRLSEVDCSRSSGLNIGLREIDFNCFQINRQRRLLLRVSRPFWYVPALCGFKGPHVLNKVFPQLHVICFVLLVQITFHPAKIFFIFG